MYSHLIFKRTQEITLARGWSTGVTGTDSDFRITQNIENNKDPSTVGLYISGDTGNVGINTDTPRGALDVLGNVIGNELSFGGLTGDEFGNFSNTSIVNTCKLPLLIA